MASASSRDVAVRGASQATELDMRDSEAVGRPIGEARAMIAVGGADGTRSEITLGLHAGKPIYALHSWDIMGVEAVDSPAEAVRRALA